MWYNISIVKEEVFYMKKGFTLQELLITLGIIGVVAALIAPAISNLFPNQHKTKYMKAYNTMTKVIDEMIDDEDLFPAVYLANLNDDGSRQEDLANTGFGSTTAVLQAPFNDETSAYNITAGDNCKFAKVFAYKLNLSSEPTFCTNGTNLSTFTTQDGTRWVIGNNGNNGKFIGIDVLPDEENGNDLYSENNTNPHRFLFSVENNGGLKSMDAMGRAYLLNPTDLHDGSKDADNAKTQTFTADEKTSISAFQTNWKALK